MAELPGGAKTEEVKTPARATNPPVRLPPDGHAAYPVTDGFDARASHELLALPAESHATTLYVPAWATPPVRVKAATVMPASRLASDRMPLCRVTARTPLPHWT